MNIEIDFYKHFMCIKRDGKQYVVRYTERLLKASSFERRNWRVIGNDAGLNWPDIDEDLSLDSILQDPSIKES